MSDEQTPPLDPNPLTADPELDAEAAAVAVDDGKGNKMVPLGSLISAKKEARSLKKRISELEPVAKRVTDVDARLDKAQPIIDAIITNPKLRAEALRMANSATRPSGDMTEQPTPDEDPDAAAFAEIQGYYLNDNVTPDLARSRRALDILDRRNRRSAEDVVRPFAGLALNERANRTLREAAAQTDSQGVPLATAESIREIAQQIPEHLLANPQVVDLVVNSAIGLDRRHGRSPKPPEEPMFLERQGGGFRQTEPTVSPEEKRALEKFGISEKDYATASRRVETAVATRRGIALE
jgi:hypothetical protein